MKNDMIEALEKAHYTFKKVYQDKEKCEEILIYYKNIVVPRLKRALEEIIDCSCTTSGSLEMHKIAEEVLKE